MKAGSRNFPAIKPFEFFRGGAGNKRRTEILHGLRKVQQRERDGERKTNTDHMMNRRVQKYNKNTFATNLDLFRSGARHIRRVTGAKEIEVKEK